MKSKMNRVILAAGFLVAGVVGANAQTVNKVGNNPMTINPHAVVELESTTKGFLAPRMTLVNKNAMTSTLATTDAGLLIFQTDSTAAGVKPRQPVGFYHFSGTQWVHEINGNLGIGKIRVGVLQTVGGLTSGISQEMQLQGDAVVIDTAGRTVTISGGISAVNVITASATLTTANNSVYVSGAITLTLPDPSLATNKGRSYQINKTDASLLTFGAYSIYDLNGTAYTTTNVQRGYRIQSNGTNWYLLN